MAIRLTRRTVLPSIGGSQGESTVQLAANEPLKPNAEAQETDGPLSPPQVNALPSSGNAIVKPSDGAHEIGLSRTAAAEYLTSLGYPISPNRLAKLASSHAGPEYWRWGNKVSYYPASLLRWAEKRHRIVRPDAEGAAIAVEGSGSN